MGARRIVRQWQNRCVSMLNRSTNIDAWRWWWRWRWRQVENPRWLQRRRRRTKVVCTKTESELSKKLNEWYKNSKHRKIKDQRTTAGTAKYESPSAPLPEYYIVIISSSSTTTAADKYIGRCFRGNKNSWHWAMNNIYSRKKKQNWKEKWKCGTHKKLKTLFHSLARSLNHFLAPPFLFWFVAFCVTFAHASSCITHFRTRNTQGDERHFSRLVLNAAREIY